MIAWIQFVVTVRTWMWGPLLRPEKPISGHTPQKTAFLSPSSDQLL